MKAKRYIIPDIFKNFEGLIAVETTRNGGVSRFPYSSLNLGLHTEDDPGSVAENRRLLFADLGISEESIASSFQVHEDRILRVEKPDQLHGYDALITNRRGIFLAVKTADCLPALVFDPEARVVAAIHAGWRGTVKEIVLKTVLKMKDAFGTDPANCLAYVGTCIDECDFEVDADVADHFDIAHKNWDPVRQKFLVDLKMANKGQLIKAGIRESKIEISPRSTVRNNDNYFSHRKEKGKTGRMLNLIGMKA